MKIRSAYTILCCTLIISCGDMNRELVFVSDRDGTLDIYVTDEDTSYFRRVTNSAAIEYAPQWSPSGDLIYFSLYDSTGANVFSIRPDGTELTPVTSDTMRNTVQGISPDGRTLLLSSRRLHPRGETHTYSLADGNWTRLTDNEFYEAGAKFSPDGKKVVISIEFAPSPEPRKAGNAEIFELDPVTGTLGQVTFTEAFDALPEYSPAGDRIAFHGCIDGFCDIFVVDLDGGNLTNLTNGEADSRWPRWSPDGSKIAYTRVWEGNSDIWVMRPDGGDKRPLIVSAGRDEVAEWRPR